MTYPMPITVSKSEFNLGEYDLIYWCRRPSTVVNLHSVTTCDVQGPIYKLSYNAKTIQQLTQSSLYPISVIAQQYICPTPIPMHR
jgi:hypothetical protein